MEEDSLRSKTVKGVFWNGVGRFSVQGVQFILSLVMARLLTPDQYGIIGMLGIFIAVATSFVDSGFSIALIRKHDRTQTDCSTMFYFNIVVGLVGYLLICAVSPWIADFFNEPILQPLAKVVSLSIVVGSLTAVQNAQYAIKMDFKTPAKANLISTIISGVFGIVLAYNGYGVWSLAWQTIVRSAVNSLLLWLYSSWYPTWEYSWQSWKSMWGFGYKLLLSGLLDTLYREIYTLVIGKVYSARDLGNYSRAKHFAELPSAQLNGILSAVAFPMLCSIHNDDARLARVYRQYLRLIAFIVFPLMIGLAAVANPLIITLLTDKWVDVVILLQIICLSMMWYPIHAINLNLLQVKGRSDLFLRLEIIKKIIGVVMLCITVPIGLKAMVIGSVFTSLICLAVNTYYTGKLINVGYWMQMRDLLPILALSLFMGFCVYMSTLFVPGYICQLVVGVSAGVLIYIGMAFMFKMPELTELLSLVKKKK